MTTLTERKANDNVEEMSFENLLGFFEGSASVQEQALPFEDFEATALARSNEVVRRCLERELQRRANALPSRVHRVGIDDFLGGSQIFTRDRLAGAVYHSLCGPLRIQRHRYQPEHSSRGSIVAVEISEGLIDKMTPALARSLVHGYANQPVRNYREDLVAAHRHPPSRATLERSAKKASSLLSSDVIVQIRKEEILEPKVAGIVLGLDRTSVPMAEYDAQKPPAKRRKPRVRKAPRPESVKWRMDYVATVSYVDKEGESLYKRCYRSSFRSDAKFIVQEMMRDVQRAFEQSSSLTIAVVQDGAPELWTVIRQQLKDVVSEHVEILDWYHVSERLSACLELCIPDATKRKVMRERWHQSLLEQEQGAEKVIRSLRRYVRRLHKSGAISQSEELGGHTRYFERRIAQLNYHQARHKGLPIGSGITEGTCKSLVAQRAKRGGQRWRPRGLSAVLSIRALRQSDRFEAAWYHKPTPRLVDLTES